MIRLLLGAVLGGAALLAWQSFDAAIGDLTGSEARVVTAALAMGFGDAGAALQEPVLKAKIADGWLVCGWVRIGEGGAVLGARPFAGYLDRSGAFSVASHAVTAGEVAAVRNVCAYRGLSL